MLRNQFEVMFDAAVSEARRMDLEDMTLPRRRHVPARIVEGVFCLFDTNDSMIAYTCRPNNHLILKF